MLLNAVNISVPIFIRNAVHAICGCFFLKLISYVLPNFVTKEFYFLLVSCAISSYNFLGVPHFTNNNIILFLYLLPYSCFVLRIYVSLSHATKIVPCKSALTKPYGIRAYRWTIGADLQDTIFSHATNSRQAYDMTYDCRSVLKHVLKCYDIFF